jgi:5S rRNA maturation endonuclease (ribonuclease M5)
MNGIPQTFNNKPRRFTWTYHSAQGEPLGYVARFDADGKKDVVPYFNRMNGHGWQTGSAAEPRPLFGLDVLAQADIARAVFIVEGEKAAAALQSLGLVAVTSQGGSKAAAKTDWKPLEGRGRVYLLPDNDAPGEAYAEAIAAILRGHLKPPEVKIIRLPDLPAGGDVADWISARIEHHFLDWDGFQPVPESGIPTADLLAEFQDVVKIHSEPVPAGWLEVPATATDWQAPISLQSTTLPPWPDDVFPGQIQTFVSGLAVSTETPPELSALMVLAALSAAAQGKYRVRVKADYLEPVNVWTCAGLPPGSRKTAVQGAATAPLSAWEKVQRDIAEPAIKQAQSNHATQTERIGQLRKMAGKAKGADFDSLKKEIAQLEAELPKIPTAPQVWAQDVTPENLGTIMADNSERMAILSDESGIFDILAGRYSGGIPNLDLFLQGHAGSPVRVNRGSRPPVFMQNPALTFGLSPQPDVLRGLTEKPSFRGRGLLGRFLYALPASNLGYRTLDARPMLGDTVARYEGILTLMLNQEMGSDKDGNPCPHILKISSDALQVWQTFAHKVEAMQREGGTFFHLVDTGWPGKFPGAVARIAALLHIARHAMGRPWEHEISLEDMAAALRLADALSAHALAVFDLMGADPALDGARVVLRWIEREGKPEFTFRDCHYAHKTRFKRAAELEPIMDVLTERHYIRPRVAKVAHRPSRILEVNPAMLGGEA